MLLSLSVAPVKPKSRQLALTSQRILCLKRRDKPPPSVSVKQEFLLTPAGKLKDKDSRLVLTSVYPKSDVEFVLSSVSDAERETNYIKIDWTFPGYQVVRVRRRRPA